MKKLEGEWQFLVNLMFHRLGKFDGPIFRERGRRGIYMGGLCLECQVGYILGGGVYIQGAYQQDFTVFQF